MICASLALAVLLNGPSAIPLRADAVASDTTPNSHVSAWYFQVAPPVEPQPGKWDPTRFDSATAVGVKAVLDSAIMHGLPYLALYNYALQGTAWRKSGTEIISKTRSYMVAMLDARAALGDNSTESELGAGADALRAGLDGKALQGIRAVRPTPGTALTALVVASDFLSRGISASQAREAVTALARTSKSDDGLNAAQSLVARNAERGPGMARDALDRYVKTTVGGAQKNAPGKPVTRPPGPPDAS